MKDYVSFPVYDGNDINENIETLQKLAGKYRNRDPICEKRRSTV